MHNSQQISYNILCNIPTASPTPTVETTPIDAYSAQLIVRCSRVSCEFEFVSKIYPLEVATRVKRYVEFSYAIVAPLRMKF